MSTTTKEQRLIDECLDCSERLTPWEEQFLESIQSSLEKFGSLTDKQRQTLSKIHEQRVMGW